MKRVKLSLPQSLFLTDLHMDGAKYAAKYAAPSYPPVRKLNALGFIEQSGGRWRITDAGKAWLTQYADQAS